jgi:hypothetical protein
MSANGQMRPHRSRNSCVEVCGVIISSLTPEGIALILAATLLHYERKCMSETATVVDFAMLESKFRLTEKQHHERQRILCIGKDAGLLRSRCAVLAYGGYYADYALFHSPSALLQRVRCGLVILSAVLSDGEGEYIAEIAGTSTTVVRLREIVFPQTLLCLVGELLRPVTRSIITAEGSVQSSEYLPTVDQYMGKQAFLTSNKD